MDEEFKQLLKEARVKALIDAARVCREYAHSDLKPSQMRRQVAYACERRILALDDIQTKENPCEIALL